MVVDRLSQEAVGRAHLTRELELAREVQERLLPGRLPEMAGLDAAAAYRSAEHRLAATTLTAAGGRGAAVRGDRGCERARDAAALLMANLRASLHELAEQAAQDLPRVMEGRNRLLYSASSASRYFDGVSDAV